MDTQTYILQICIGNTVFKSGECKDLKAAIKSARIASKQELQVWLGQTGLQAGFAKFSKGKVDGNQSSYLWARNSYRHNSDGFQSLIWKESRIRENASLLKLSQKESI